MPRINSALHRKGQKLPTRDKKKWQRSFDHDPEVLSREKIHKAVKALSEPKPWTAQPMTVPPDLVDLASQLGANMALTLDDLVKKTLDVEGNLTTKKWADESDPDFNTTTF